VSNPVNQFAEADSAESQRKAFQGIGCAAGALAFPAPFIFGFPGGLSMVPVLVIIGLVFMFLAMAAKGRRNRIVAAVAQAQQGQFPAAATNNQPIYLPPVASTAPAVPAATPTPSQTSPAVDSSDSEAKLNQRLNKAKKAGL
jgi:hypothetical protein